MYITIDQETSTEQMLNGDNDTNMTQTNDKEIIRKEEEKGDDEKII